MDEVLFDIGPAHTTGWPECPRYLMSYAYVDDEQVALARRYGFDLVMDSGAFTTAASGKPMDHDGYLDWLLEHSDDVTFALSLDVIGDHRASAANHDHGMKRIGDRVQLVPTYHLGSPMSEFRRLCTEHDMVSIGGAVPFARQSRHLYQVLKQIHRVAAELDTRLHGLGMTSSAIIHGFPWASVDSSGWTAPVRFPSLPLANEQGRICGMEQGWRLDREESRLVTAYGGDPQLVATKGWSLLKVVGEDDYLRNVEWVLTATARSYMYVEAAKNAHTPHTPIRVYLSGEAPWRVHDHAIGVIHRAHTLGNPWKDPA